MVTHAKQTLTGRIIVQNIIAAITVSFVALSLGAAFGLLSGRGAFAGMISAAIIAFITSLLGGTRVQCSGPTGPMTAVTATIVALSHDLVTSKLAGINADHFINVVILMNALLLIVMAILRLGKYVKYVPNVVISGFMNGIAVIIWLDQIKRLFGIGGKEAFTGPFLINLVFVVSAAALTFVLPSLFRKIMPKYASLISGTLLAIVIMTIISYLLKLPIEKVTLSASIRSFSDFTNIVHSQIPTTLNYTMLKLAFPFALQLAILAYLDTLMTSLVVDKLTKENTKQNKELMAQGLAIGATALVGGIPGAQATIRSVLLFKEKATLRLAGILVGVFAMIEMLLLQNYISLIPQAVFAGILIKVGYDVFDWLPARLYIKEFFKNRHEMFHNIFSRHDDEKIFVTHLEMFIIAGATLVTILIDLNVAVGLFTLLFYLVNKVFWRNKPIRDLQPLTETEAISRED